MRSVPTAGLFFFAGLALSARAADLPDYQLTAPQATQLKATTVVYQTIHTTITAQAEPLRATLSALFAKLKTAGIAPRGGPIFIYKTLVKDPTKPLDVEVAIPVADDTSAPKVASCAFLRQRRLSPPSFKDPSPLLAPPTPTSSANSPHSANPPTASYASAPCTSRTRPPRITSS